MAVFRYQVVAVGRWRGKIKRWNTTFHMSNATSAPAIRDAMNSVCFKATGDVVGACSGGIASISVYNAAGGPPVQIVKYFDWETPTTWIPFTGNVWGGLPAGTTVDASGESALVVTGAMPGLSRTGKPVFTRKYIHAVPSRTAAALTDPDISAATQTAIKSTMTGSMMGNKAGVFPTAIKAEPYYGNHQRVRGKRKSRRTVAGQSFSNGVIVGGTSAAPQGAAPFQ